MELKSFDRDPGLKRDFLDFPKKLYGTDKNWAPYMISNQEDCLAPTFRFYQNPENCYRHFLIYSGIEVAGRITAFVNHGMHDDQGKAVKALGFFECIDDKNIASRLIGAGVEWLLRQNGSDRILGPINFDIWAGYRFLKSCGRNPYLLEPYNKPGYSLYFSDFGFREKYLWYSYHLSQPEEVRQLAGTGTMRQEMFMSKGYRFESMEDRDFDQSLTIIYQIMQKSFSGFKSFTPISLADFMNIFYAFEKMIDPALFTFVYDPQNKPVGFVCSLPDWADALRFKYRKETRAAWYASRHLTKMILYMGGILPEHSQNEPGLGRAMFAYNLQCMLRRGAGELFVALIAAGNKSMNYMTDFENNRSGSYALYEYEV